MFKNIFFRFPLFSLILLMWLAIASGSAWAQSNCGVSVNLSLIGKDTIQQQPLTERCIYRVTISNTRNDVHYVTFKPQYTSTTSIWIITPGGPVTSTVSGGGMFAFWMTPFPTGNYYIGNIYISGPTPQSLIVFFENGNNAVICTT